MPFSSLESYLAPLVTGKRVAILGFGREGQSSYRTLRRLFPDLALTVIDQVSQLPPSAGEVISADKQLELFLGPDSLSKLPAFEVIFKSPGVSPYLVEVQEAVSRGALLTSQTDIFFALYGAKIVAVTGTKGKSTASQAILQVLSHAGRSAMLIGNIGAPAFDSLDKIGADTTVVYETSSHQAEGLRHNPHIAVFLNLYVDHLDYYPSMEQYALAKRQLFMTQKSDDLCLYRLDDPKVTQLVADLPVTKLGFSLETNKEAVCRVDGDWIVAFGEKLIETAKIPLLGKHNLVNVMPAILVAHLFKIPNAEIAAALQKVTPVGGRLDTVAEVGGIKFVDDALATIPEATIAALDALGPQVSTLIAGGFDRGQDFGRLVDKIAVSGIKNLILFPTTGEKIANALMQRGARISLFPVKSMEEAVKIALKKTEAGKTVLLSTASASFGLFADYRDRSEQYYREIIKQGRANSAKES